MELWKGALCSPQFAGGWGDKTKGQRQMRDGRGTTERHSHTEIRAHSLKLNDEQSLGVEATRYARFAARK